MVVGGKDQNWNNVNFQGLKLEKWAYIDKKNEKPLAYKDQFDIKTFVNNKNMTSTSK